MCLKNRPVIFLIRILKLFLIFEKMFWIYNAIDKWLKEDKKIIVYHVILEDKNLMVLDEKQKKIFSFE